MQTNHKFPVAPTILGHISKYDNVDADYNRATTYHPTMSYRAAPILDEPLPEGNVELVGTLQRRRPRRV